MRISFNKSTSLLVIYYLIIALWWLTLFLLHIKGGTIGYLYQFAFGLIPLLWGVFGIIKSKEWGFVKSRVGATIFFVSTGLVTWGIGQMFWSIYYNLLLHVAIPYPSLSDVGYILSWPLWAIGIINLSHATGAKFSLKKVKGKIFLFIIPLVLIALSYYLLVTIARAGQVSDFTGGAYKIFFDLAYPIGDVVILSLAILIYGLSFKYLGGRYKFPIIILLLGFVVNYIVDFSFSYTTTNNTYYDGHWVDLLFPTAMMLIAFGINSFDTGEKA